MPLPPPQRPWYGDGLRFRCTACGKCCTGEPGYVWVGTEDVARMAAARGLTEAEFSRRFVRRVGERLSLKERGNGDCVMLEDGRCTVYAAKPTQCSTFPFWEGVLETKETWAETAAKCPGMDQGDLYDVADIAVLAGGVPEPLLARQAAARGEAPGDLAGLVAGIEAERLGPALLALAELYAALDRELPRYKFVCQASGDCCDLSRSDRRLYASTLEAAWFLRASAGKRANDDPGACPAFGADRLCHEREGRFLACRTFFCGSYRQGDPAEVHARWHRRLKELHDAHGIPWRYALVTAWAAARP